MSDSGENIWNYASASSSAVFAVDMARHADTNFPSGTYVDTFGAQVGM